MIKETATTKDGRSIQVYSCEKCKKVYNSDYDADYCCRTKKCKECGEEYSYFLGKRGLCSDCLEKILYQEAKPVNFEEYKGEFIYNGDDFVLTDEDSLIDFLNDRDLFNEAFSDEKIKFLACVPREWKGLDIDLALENSLEEFSGPDYEAIEHLDDLGELKNYIQEWNKKQNIEVWDPDYTRKVLLKDFVMKALKKEQESEVVATK